MMGRLGMLGGRRRSALIASILIATVSIVGSVGRGDEAARRCTVPGKGRKEDKISQWSGGGGSVRGQARATTVRGESDERLHYTTPRYLHDGPWEGRESSLSQEVEEEGDAEARGPGMASSRLRLRLGNDGAMRVDDGRRGLIKGGKKSSTQGGRFAIKEAGHCTAADETAIARRSRAGERRKKSGREERSSSYETMSWSAHSEEDQSFHSSDDDDDDDDIDSDDDGETGGDEKSPEDESTAGTTTSSNDVEDSSSIESRLRRVDRGGGGRGDGVDDSAPRGRANVPQGNLSSKDARGRGRNGGGRGRGGRRMMQESSSSESGRGGEVLGSSSDDFGEGGGTRAMVVDARQRHRQRQRNRR